MNKLLEKLGKKITGSISLPGDKSISIRASLISNLFDGDFDFENFNFCDDTKTAISCIKELSKINDKTYEKKCKTIILDCKNSATTMRLLCGMLCSLYAGLNIKFKLIGDNSLTKRPMDRIVKPLKKMGANISCYKDKTAPIIIDCKKCHIKDFSYISDISSAQVKSCLELCAFCAGTKLKYKEKYTSRDHTKIMLDYFSFIEHENHHHDENFECHHHKHSEHIYTIPSDISLASYFIANTIIYKDSKIKLTNLLMNPTRTGFLDALNKMGVKYILTNKIYLQDEKVADLSISYKNQILKSININESQIPSMIDEVPLLAILLAKADGTSTIRGISELRVKESDRVSAISCFLGLFNVNYTIKENVLKIYGDKNLDFTNIHKNINSKKLSAKQKKSLEQLLCSKDHRILLILKLLNIKGIEYPKYLNTSI